MCFYNFLMFKPSVNWTRFEVLSIHSFTMIPTRKDRYRYRLPRTKTVTSPVMKPQIQFLNRRWCIYERTKCTIQKRNTLIAPRHNFSRIIRQVVILVRIIKTAPTESILGNSFSAAGNKRVRQLSTFHLWDIGLGSCWTERQIVLVYLSTGLHRKNMK